MSPREAEGAAWREIVQERLGDVPVCYNENGAPVVPEGFIGISHTRGWVAAVWSPEPCAVDVELKDRVLSPTVMERYGFHSMNDWCAFEARYKYRGLTGRSADGPVEMLDHRELIVAVIW